MSFGETGLSTPDLFFFFSLVLVLLVASNTSDRQACRQNELPAGLNSAQSGEWVEDPIATSLALAAMATSRVNT